MRSDAHLLWRRQHTQGHGKVSSDKSLDNTVSGKHDELDEVAMMQLLDIKWHEVYTVNIIR